MKKNLLLTLALVLVTGLTAWAQVPQKFNYQGIARNGSGAPPWPARHLASGSRYTMAAQVAPQYTRRPTVLLLMHMGFTI